MDIRRSWVAVGTVAVLGVGATATAALALDDRAPLPPGSAVELTPTTGDDDGRDTGPAAVPVDTSPESADSPNASAVDSAASAADAPVVDEVAPDSTPDSTADSPW